MWRKVLFLVGSLWAFSVLANTNHELIQNLKSRVKSLGQDQGSLIKSFNDHSQSFIYDQALAVIAFTQAGEKKAAQELLKGLKTLQQKDGSLYFSYYMNGSSPYPQEGDKRIAGAISWVALSAVHYQNKFKSKEFLSFNHKILKYLQSEITPLSIKGEPNFALRFAPHDVSSTPFDESRTVALEHNLDAYSAFLHFAKVNKTKKWNKDINHLKKFVFSMWDKTHSHFWSGADLKTGYINKSELYLDNQTWSLLALDPASLKEISPDDALKMNCDKLFASHDGISGFIDSKPSRGPAADTFVWSEGTLGQILAMRKLRKIKNEPVYCRDMLSKDLLENVMKMKKSDGGIAYATKNRPDFTTSSSVAGTAWLYFASNDFNPFHMDEVN